MIVFSFLYTAEFEDADVNVDDTNAVSGPPEENVTTSHRENTCSEMLLLPD